MARRSEVVNNSAASHNQRNIERLESAEERDSDAAA
jgi:hypothetical protein